MPDPAVSELLREVAADLSAGGERAARWQPPGAKAFPLLPLPEDRDVVRIDKYARAWALVGSADDPDSPRPAVGDRVLISPWSERAECPPVVGFCRRDEGCHGVVAEELNGRRWTISEWVILPDRWTEPEPTDPGRGAEDEVKPWDSDHTALVHVLWAAERSGLVLGETLPSGDEATDRIARLIMGSTWLRAVREHAVAEVTAEREGLRSVIREEAVEREKQRDERDRARLERLAVAAELDRLRRAYAVTSHEVEQTLGKALAYPAMGPELFEDGIPDGSVCVGDHVPQSLATEAAQRIADLEAEVARLRDGLTGLLDNHFYRRYRADGPDGWEAHLSDKQMEELERMGALVQPKAAALPEVGTPDA